MFYSNKVKSLYDFQEEYCHGNLKVLKEVFLGNQALRPFKLFLKLIYYWKND